MEDQRGDSLRPRLEEAEQIVQEALDDVCSARPAHELNTGELIRVEETLAIAAEAAKEAVTIRRKLRQDVS